MQVYQSPNKQYFWLRKFGPSEVIFSAIVIIYIFLNEKLHCVHVINSFLYPILIFENIDHGDDQNMA